MDENNVGRLKKLAVVCISFIISYLLLWGMLQISFLFDYSAFQEEIIRICMEQKIVENPQGFCIEKNPHLLYSIHGEALGFDAKANDSQLVFIVLPLMGRYGRHIALFVKKYRSDAHFCGLINIPDPAKSYRYYGISSVTLEHYKKKIDTAFRDQGSAQ